MKLIVGLGNPGVLYEATRHNIGFKVLKNLARKFKTGFKRERLFPALSAKARIGAENIILAMPMTFMNLSGQPVKALLKRYGVGPQDLLVVCDDLDLEFARIKLSSSGSSAGHRGIQSVSDCLESRDFCRLRIGIGRAGRDARDYVLSRFTKSERTKLPEIIGRASECCEAWVTEGSAKTMNIFNVRSKKE